MKSDVNIAKVPKWVLGVRLAFELLLRPFLPYIILDKNHSIKKFHEASGRGDGLIIVFTHFSLRDAMDVNRVLIYTDPILKDREVVNPLAYHQYNKFMELVGRLFHGTFAPVINNSTIKKKGFEHLPKGKGLKEFVEKSANVLTQGGIVSLAINATRSEKLDMEDKQKPVGYLIASLQAKGVKDYGILLINFSIKGAKNYSKKEAGGFNFGKTYFMNYINYYSLSRLINRPEVSGKVGNVDAFLRSELAKVSPKEYLS